MIKSISNKIAEYIAKDDETADIEEIAYGYDLLLQELGVVVVSLIIGFVLNITLQVVISVFFYNTLRMYAGGAHANYRAVCIITSILIMFGPALLFTRTPFFFPIIAYPIIYMFCLLMLFLYAPADTETQPIQNLETRKIIKRKAILALTVLFIIASITNIWLPDYASIMLVIIIIVCTFTHSIIYRLFGCKKSIQ